MSEKMQVLCSEANRVEVGNTTVSEELSRQRVNEITYAIPSGNVVSSGGGIYSSLTDLPRETRSNMSDEHIRVMLRSIAEEVKEVKQATKQNELKVEEGLNRSAAIVNELSSVIVKLSVNLATMSERIVGLTVRVDANEKEWSRHKEELVSIRQSLSEERETIRTETEGIVSDVGNMAIVNSQKIRLVTDVAEADRRECNARIDAVSQRITEVSNHMSRVDREVVMSEQTSPSFNEVKRQYRDKEMAPAIMSELPKFHGYGGIHPKSYIDKLRQYFRLRNLDIEDYVSEIELSLGTEAKQWYEVEVGSVDSFESFSEKILKRYWNAETQLFVRNEIEKQRYKAGQGTTRAKHMRDCVIRLRYLQPALSEEQIISICINQYEYNLVITLRTRLDWTVETLLNYLEGIENLVKVNETDYEPRYCQKVVKQKRNTQMKQVNYKTNNASKHRMIQEPQLEKFPPDRMSFHRRVRNNNSTYQQCMDSVQQSATMPIPMYTTSPSAPPTPQHSNRPRTSKGGRCER